MTLLRLMITHVRDTIILTKKMHKNVYNFLKHFFTTPPFTVFSVMFMIMRTFVYDIHVKSTVVSKLLTQFISPT